MNKKRILIAVIFIIFSQISRAQSMYSFLDVNEKVDKYPAVTWLKGEALTEFEPNKGYVLELWATWCKPCVRAVPHVGELATKFKGKVTFVSQNVWETDTAKVRDFVAKNAANFVDCKVAFDGGQNQAAFDKDWLKPSGTFGIPRTFLIYNKTIIWITDPFQLTAEHLQLLAEGKLTDSVAKEIAQKNK